jgi:hypothetical protein
LASPEYSLAERTSAAAFRLTGLCSRATRIQSVKVKGGTFSAVFPSEKAGKTQRQDRPPKIITNRQCFHIFISLIN